MAIASRETNECSERETSGLICQSCELLARCVRIDGAWETIPVEKCNPDEGFFCNLANKGCSNRTGPCNPFGFEQNFPCTSEGVFPNPYDCQKYHMCHRVVHSPIPETVECGGDRAFSAASGDCSLSIRDDVCTEPQYKCKNAGDSHAWPGNSNIFYICKAKSERGVRILFPTLYRCSAGEIFNGHDCVPKQPHIIGAGGGEIIDHQPFVCEKSGLFADTHNCQSYYYCDSFLRLRKYTCPSRTHFDNRVKACMSGSC